VEAGFEAGTGVELPNPTNREETFILRQLGCCETGVFTVRRADTSQN
jgi:hypothetical protein